MQALIDFDGWRKWKDFSLSQETEKEKSAKLLATKKKKANRSSVGSSGVIGTPRGIIREESES